MIDCEKRSDCDRCTVKPICSHVKSVGEEFSNFYGSQYQKLAMRTNDGKSTMRLVVADAKAAARNIDFGGAIAACMGLSGEVGELNDLVKKFIFHEKEFDETHLKKELGDVCWYIALMCESFGWNLNDILQMNIEKLKKRYPDGFDVDRANHRKEGDV